MTTLNKPSLLKQVFILVLTFSFSTVIFAQDDSTVQDDATKQKKEKKARNSFKVSAGVNFNNLSLDSADEVKSNVASGYNLGLSYKRGRFLYYEVGARYNNKPFEVTDVSDPNEANQTDSSFSVSAIDIPLTGGINITSFADRLVGVRVFLSAVPSFSLGKDVDELGLDKDDITNFMIYGQGGVGIDIAFFFIEAGFNYGFSNIINDIANESIKSKPSQGYVNIGFRF
jgi:hypothetical protein